MYQVKIDLRKYGKLTGSGIEISEEEFYELKKQFFTSLKPCKVYLTFDRGSNYPIENIEYYANGLKLMEDDDTKYYVLQNSPTYESYATGEIASTSLSIELQDKASSSGHTYKLIVLEL